jgi:hypothetical protein
MANMREGQEGAPNLHDFQKMITRATSPEASNFTHNMSIDSMSVEPIPLNQLDKDNMSSYSLQTRKGKQPHGIDEDLSSYAGSEKSRFDSFNISALDGEEV